MFKKAEKSGIWLKLAITGPSGSGKTTAALRLARGLLDGLYGAGKERIAVIDTENRSASLYADKYDFDVSDIEPPFDDADKFTDAINAAIGLGYKALIIDSASHVWEGVLEFKDKLDKGSRANSFTNWREAGDRFKKVISLILQSDIHVICCMRSKMEYVVEQNDKGKQIPRKVGLAPIMRDGIEYEFSAVLDLDLSHNASASKDRTRIFDGKVFEITEKTGDALARWTGMPSETMFPKKDADSARLWAEKCAPGAYEQACAVMGVESLEKCAYSRKSEFVKIVKDFMEARETAGRLAAERDDDDGDDLPGLEGRGNGKA